MIETAEHWWDDWAACYAHPDPNLWYEVEDAAEVGRNPDPARVEAALAICGMCTIRDECARRGASERHGIWGGLTADERRKR